ncbi:GtrA family protein [Marinomonas ostreistagni]|uniref:GtrA family protein n=1 Tax=Marinomonas ostreistagni TaxID=359209 RepID=A0ABS0ZDL6_9GAMM|nr:GtrA family protein [Marinomonas ostreistagni]MBJ7551762.1 GtrA family protein [Marinomonas ostreistagni]
MKRQFIKFGLVGSIGFLVDISILWLLSHWLPYPTARAVSFWGAVTSNWWLNRVFTFQDAEHAEKPHQQWGKFFLASLVGFIPNWGGFVIMMWFGEVQGFTNYAIFPYVAIIPGVLAGMIINFSLSKVWVFKA